MNFGKKATAAITAGLMAASAIAPTGIALAEQNQPSVGERTGSGVTDLTMVIENTGEHGGTDEPELIENPNFDQTQPISDDNPKYIENPYYNPDLNNDGLGDNIAFTVPSAINYVVKADGSLVGPAARFTYIDNESAFKINVSSVDVDEKDGFTIVPDARETNTKNAVDLQFGPANDMLQASEYLEKKEVNNPTMWSMEPTKNGPLIPVTASDRIQIESTGSTANITNDITQRTKFGQIRWYVQPTEAPPTLSKATANGTEFNNAIRQLAENNQGTIKRIVTVQGTPDTTNGIPVSYYTYVDTGELPIYATFDAQTGTLTLTSEADKILISQQASSMFQNLTDLTYVDGRNIIFYDIGIQNAANMFAGCSNLETIDGVENWFAKSEYRGDFNSMFANCTKLTADCSNWNVDIEANDTTTATTFNMGANNVIAPTWGEYTPTY